MNATDEGGRRWARTAGKRGSRAEMLCRGSRHLQYINRKFIQKEDGEREGI